MVVQILSIFCPNHMIGLIILLYRLLPQINPKLLTYRLSARVNTIFTRQQKQVVWVPTSCQDLKCLFRQKHMIIIVLYTTTDRP